jgi:hypothetical protein
MSTVMVCRLLLQVHLVVRRREGPRRLWRELGWHCWLLEEEEEVEVEVVEEAEQLGGGRHLGGASTQRSEASPKRFADVRRGLMFEVKCSLFPYVQ